MLSSLHAAGAMKVDVCPLLGCRIASPNPRFLCCRDFAVVLDYADVDNQCVVRSKHAYMRRADVVELCRHLLGRVSTREVKKVLMKCQLRTR